MARIRSIKPEFPQSETIGRLSRDARLLFIQLWTLVDDEGRTRAASRMLASLLYPYDDDAPKLIEGWLQELERNECIRRYEVEGSQYLEVANWLKHQKIDKPSKSKIPSFDEHSCSVRETSRKVAPDLGSRILDLGSSVSSDTGGKPPDYPADPTERLWAEGVDLLTAMHAQPKAARSNIGRWLKSGSPTEVLEAIRLARDKGTHDPIPLVSRVLSQPDRKQPQGGSSHEASVTHAGDRLVERIREREEREARDWPPTLLLS